MRYTQRTTKLLDAVPRDVLPGHCFVEKRKSRAVEVANGLRPKLKNVVFAYLPYGTEFWADPIQIADEVGSGHKISYDLRPKNIMVASCKLKFTSPSGTFTDHIDADPGLFISCVGLTTKASGEFTIWYAQMVLPVAAQKPKRGNKVENG